MFDFKAIKVLACGLMATLAVSSNSAYAATTCGVFGNATLSPVVYDPLNPVGLPATTMTLNMTRINAPSGPNTTSVNFYLKSNSAAADGTSIVANSVSIPGAQGLGLNVFYNFTAGAPSLFPATSTPTAGNRFLHLVFAPGTTPGIESAAVSFTVTLPPNANINASSSLPVDVYYSCIAALNGDSADGSGQVSGAVVFPIRVLSVLRTYYAGTALDFGEIGAVSTASLTGAPRKTNPSNYVFVQSTGAYSVTLSSQNAFKLKKPGAATISDEVKYNLHFLGLDVNNATTPTVNATAITRNCVRATFSTAGNSLPIQANLQEGGQGKNPSPTYTDVLTVTVTPLIYSDPGVSSCASFGL